jgi:hypothetical protein
LAGFYSVKGGWKLREAAKDFALRGWEDPGDGKVKGGGFGVGGRAGGRAAGWPGGWRRNVPPVTADSPRSCLPLSDDFQVCCS